MFQLDGRYKISSSPGDVVERMRGNISGSGRNMAIDNWLTNYELVHRMLNRHRNTVVGTLRNNKREIPATFITDKGRVKDTILFGFEEKCALLSNVPKKNNVVLLLPAMHNDDKINESTGDARKAEMIIFCNKTKGE